MIDEKNFSPFARFIREQLKDPEFKAEYEAALKSCIEARTAAVNTCNLCKIMVERKGSIMACAICPIAALIGRFEPLIKTLKGE